MNGRLHYHEVGVTTATTTGCSNRYWDGALGYNGFTCYVHHCDFIVVHDPPVFRLCCVYQTMVCPLYTAPWTHCITTLYFIVLIEVTNTRLEAAVSDLSPATPRYTEHELLGISAVLIKLSKVKLIT